MSADSHTQSVQDYLKAVYRLAKAEKPVGTNELADELAVAPASVTGMLKRLAKEGYVEYAPRQGAELTAKGREVALEMVRHHRLLEAFFVQRLGMDWAQAHREAEILEHYISEDLENIIDSQMGHPESDPQGSPIPTRDGEVRPCDWPSLDQMAAGQSCVIRRVRHDDRELLRHIEQIGLVPGTRLVVRGVGPFEGPVELSTGGRKLHLGIKVASAIQVEPMKPIRARSRQKSRSRTYSGRVR